MKNSFKVHTELGACKREEIKILMDFRLCCRMQHNFYFAKHILVCDWRRGKDREWEGNRMCWNSILEVKLLSTVIVCFITNTGTWTAVNLDYTGWGCGSLTLCWAKRHILRWDWFEMDLCELKPRQCFHPAQLSKQSRDLNFEGFSTKLRFVTIHCKF